MKAKITKIEFPFYDKYKDNCVVYFDYLGKECKGIITKNMLNFNSLEFVNIGQEINVFKSFKGDKCIYKIMKIYKLIN